MKCNDDDTFSSNANFIILLPSPIMNSHLIVDMMVMLHHTTNHVPSFLTSLNDITLISNFFHLLHRYFNSFTSHYFTINLIRKRTTLQIEILLSFCALCLFSLPDIVKGSLDIPYHYWIICT